MMQILIFLTYLLLYLENDGYIYTLVPIYKIDGNGEFDNEIGEKISRVKVKDIHELKEDTGSSIDNTNSPDCCGVIDTLSIIESLLFVPVITYPEIGEKISRVKVKDIHELKEDTGNISFIDNVMFNLEGPSNDIMESIHIKCLILHNLLYLLAQVQLIILILLIVVVLLILCL